MFLWTRNQSEPARDPIAIDLRTAPEPAQDLQISEQSVIQSPATKNPGFEPDRGDPAKTPVLGGEVLVRFESDHRPAPGAAIYWFDTQRLADPHCSEDLDLLGMGADFFARNGLHFVSDASGRARVPLASGTVQVLAMTRSQFGMTTLQHAEQSAKPIVVDLRAAFGLDVIVRSASTHVPVSDVAVVAQCSQFQDSKIGALTDKRGSARLWPLFKEAEPRGRWYVQLPGIYREELRVPIELEERAKAIELNLPESALAVVRIVDSSGELCPLSGRLQIGWNDKDGDPAQPAEVSISEGIANLARVEIGLTVHVRALLAGTSEEPTSAFDMNDASKDRARFDLVLKQPMKTLRARFQDLDGNALEFTSATCALAVRHGNEVRIERPSFLSRAEGQAVCIFDADQAADGLCTIAVEVQTAQGSRLGGVFHAALKATSTDLGQLHLAPAQLLFAGRALDKLGRAVPGAGVELSREFDKQNASAFRTIDCRTDSEGRFELRGWAEPGAFVLTLSGSAVSTIATASLGDFAVELRGN